MTCKLCGGELVLCQGDMIVRSLEPLFPQLDVQLSSREWRCEECSEENGVDEEFIEATKQKAILRIDAGKLNQIKFHAGVPIPINISESRAAEWTPNDWVYVVFHGGR